MNDRLRIIQGDCVEQTNLLPAESVHLVVCSPPYDSLRFFGGTEPPKWDFALLALELFRVLVPGVDVCWNVGDACIEGYPIKDKPNATAGMVGNLGVNTFMKRDGERSTRSKHVTAELGMRHNVWRGPTRGQEDMCCELKHPAMMPKWLARDLILSWSNVGDVVLDPMCGSGTVCKMAIEHGRRAIGFDRNADYVALANQECSITPGLPLA